jgi:hypothetical protein
VEGRQKKKHFHNEMDDMEKDYNNDMHNFGDFNQIKNTLHYFVCHGESHTIDRYKEEPKRNRRTRGAVGRNSRLETTDVIEVSHTYCS